MPREQERKQSSKISSLLRICGRAQLSGTVASSARPRRTIASGVGSGCLGGVEFSRQLKPDGHTHTSLSCKSCYSATFPPLTSKRIASLLLCCAQALGIHPPGEPTGVNDSSSPPRVLAVAELCVLNLRQRSCELPVDEGGVGGAVGEAADGSELRGVAGWKSGSSSVRGWLLRRRLEEGGGAGRVAKNEAQKKTSAEKVPGCREERVSDARQKTSRRASR